MSIVTASIPAFFRHLVIRFVAIAASFAVALPALPLAGFAPEAHAGQKHKGGTKAHRGGVRKVHVKRSGGHRTVRSHGSVRKGGGHTVRVTSRTTSPGTYRNVKTGSRSYTIRRSVLDGRSHAGMRHGSVRKGGMYNVKRYGDAEHHSVRGYAHKRTGEHRSGVRLGHAGSIASKSVTGLTEVAGGRSVVRKTRLGKKGHHKGYRRHGKRHHHKATGFTSSGAVVVVLEGGHSQGLEEVAGAGSGQSDCAYGSYCTIDLGGPKIITFNDVGDISDGAIEDEELTDEEYARKYGGK